MKKGLCIGQVVPVGFILLAAMLIGCTTQPGSSDTPGVIHFPEVNSADWIKSMASVCIQVEQSYPGVVGHTEPIAEELKGILDRIGVQATIGEGTGCEAVLTLTLTFTPVPEDVIGAGQCYLAAESSGEASISASGHDTVSLPLEHARPTDGGFGMTFISECPGPDQAPFDTAWTGEVAYMLREWWGSPALVSALKSENSSLRWAASNQFRSLGIGASDAVPVLIEMLRDADPGTRASAARALGALGPAATAAVSALIEAVNDTDTSVQHEVIVALGIMADSRAVPALTAALHHSDDYTRFVAAEALEQMGPDAAPAVPDLIEVLDDEFDQVGWSAVDALGAIGPAAREATPFLIDLLEDEDWSPHFVVADALESITGQDFGEDPADWRLWWQSQ